MNKKVMILILVAVLSTLDAAYSAPSFEAELIFPRQNKHVHSSCVVECPNGDLLSCWFHGSGERSANDVVIQGARLEKGAKEWSERFLMADTPDFPDCNPVMFIDAEERLRLIWITVLGQGWQHSLTRIKTSEDYQGEGAPKWKWKDSILLKPGEAFHSTIVAKFKELDVEEGWGEYAPAYTDMVAEAATDMIKRQTGWMPRILPVTLPSGRVLLPLYSDGFNVSLIAISDDAGNTWRASKPLVGFGPIQPTITRKKDGTLVAFMRDSGPPPARVLTAESTDDGESWSAAVDTDLPNPGSSLSAITLESGEWVMALNDSEDGRNQLAIALSEDEGANWKWSRYIDRAEQGVGSYAYPNLMQTKDGKIHISYSYKDEGAASIKHAVFNTDWIKQGN